MHRPGSNSTRHRLSILLLIALEFSALLGAQEGTSILEAASSLDGKAPCWIDRGSDELPLMVPRDEELVYQVEVAWGVLQAAIGTVTMTSGVEPYRPSLLLDGNGGSVEPGAETAWVKAHAYGKHLLYTMDATLEARHQPQEWPRLVYRSTQEGSEQRRRELLFGLKDRKSVSSYRSDTSRGAPRGTRIWKEPEFRDVPPDALDMTSAVYLVRVFIVRGLAETKFTVLEKRRLWEITLSRGETRVQETTAGRFASVEVILQANPHPGEPEDAKTERFEGLFGLRGSIHLWVELHTGIPVRIQGEVPAGPLMLDVDIQLASHRGTPRSLRSLPPVESK